MLKSVNVYSGLSADGVTEILQDYISGTPEDCEINYEIVLETSVYTDGECISFYTLVVEVREKEE